MIFKLSLVCQISSDNPDSTTRLCFNDQRDYIATPSNCSEN